MATCYVAWTHQGADAMWAAPRHDPTFVWPGVQRPALPWLASAIMPHALRLNNAQELMFQLTDLARCAAWAILEEAAATETL